MGLFAISPTELVSSKGLLKDINSAALDSPTASFRLTRDTVFCLGVTRLKSVDNLYPARDQVFKEHRDTCLCVSRFDGYIKHYVYIYVNIKLIGFIKKVDLKTHIVDFYVYFLSKNKFDCLFFEQSVIGYWLIMRFFLGFLSFLRSVSQNLIAKIDRTFT